jgi:hypothetical protein
LPKSYTGSRTAAKFGLAASQPYRRRHTRPPLAHTGAERDRCGDGTIRNPVIVLGPARSYTTLVTAMLSQHPQLFGFPETHLLMTRTLAEWAAIFSGEFTRLGQAGLLRLVAQLIAGVQSADAVRYAQSWLRQRLHRSSGQVFRELAACVFPRTPIDKSPLMVQRLRSLRCAFSTFPHARFLHLTRHPVSQGLSMLNFVDEVQTLLGVHAPFPSEIRAHPALPPLMCRTRGGTPVLDPQVQWYREHLNILALLAEVPPRQQLRIRGEDLLSNPDSVLRQITAWLGLRSDTEVLDRMTHPERWEFARLGPHNARFGNDPNFCRDPVLRARDHHQESLEDPLPWRGGSTGVDHRVRRLAQQFGYS